MELEFIFSIACATVVAWAIELFMTRRRIRRLDREFQKRVDYWTKRDSK